jgi:hypothetical protein
VCPAIQEASRLNGVAAHDPQRGDDDGDTKAMMRCGPHTAGSHWTPLSCKRGALNCSQRNAVKAFRQIAGSSVFELQARPSPQPYTAVVNSMTVVIGVLRRRDGREPSFSSAGEDNSKKKSRDRRRRGTFVCQRAFRTALRACRTNQTCSRRVIECASSTRDLRF